MKLYPYKAPAWAQHLKNIPSHRFRVGMFPTPVHRFQLRGRHWLIKRDDATDCALGGNKVRKLNFLMADAVKQGADCVVTVGGVQSNHARATALFARRLGLDPFLVLRTAEDPAVVPVPEGNLFLNRLCGAHVRLVSRAEYARLGQGALLEKLALQLRRAGRTPYVIPVGGSTPIGLWGYLDAVHEFEMQREEEGNRAAAADRIVFACGSGGTAAGLALGVRLCELPVKVHAVAVCDSAESFYQHVGEAIQSVGALSNLAANQMPSLQSLLTVDDSFKGRYIDHPDFSTDEEMDLMCEAAHESGIPFDPCYTVKGLRGMLATAEDGDPSRTMFWHTGGLFGSFSHASKLNQKQLFRGSLEKLS